ncbi:MAG: linoleoyl-CoA desaturase [Frankiales bacterium]|nr:linoleoyl-CoA desaturase [Frankiales bacterium]
MTTTEPRSALQAVADGPVPGRRRSARRRRLEPWRDAAAIGAIDHAVLLAAALLRPGLLGLLLLSLALGVGLSTGTLTVLHDAGHRMFGRRAWPNVLAVQLSVPVGLWVGQWTLKHRVHHRLSQVYPVDENTRSSSLLRLHPEAPLKPVHRFQHLYAPLLYSLAWIGEVKSQLTYLVTGVVTGAETPTAARRTGSFLVEKLLCAAVLTPYGLALGWGRLAVLVVLAMTWGSLLTAVVLVVGHINVGLEGEPGGPGRSWSTHLVRTTASFRTGSRTARFWTGGMTLHLAHHLRPVALRSELPEVNATVVRDLVAASGLTACEFRTFHQAVAAHLRRLRELGAPPAVHGPV